MKGFTDIIGHEQIIEHFQNSLRARQISHAYILNGENGSGKNMLASAFAKALVCEAGYGDACNMCKACRQFDGGNHPDVRRVFHEKKTGIGVDEVREQICNDVLIKPYSSKYKIYIVDEAEKMTPQAQNALLKTIEEPPSYAVIMLLTNSVEALLPTIRSRCILLNLHSVDTDKIRDFLMQVHHVPDYQARVCASYAQGNTGRALLMATSENFREMHELMLRTVKRVDDMKVSDMAAAVVDISKYKAQIGDFLDLMMVWYRDVLVLKATGDLNAVVYKDEYRYLKRKAETSSYEGISRIFEAMDNARTRINANASFEWTIELLLVMIKEN